MIENEKYKTNSQTVEGLIGDIINKNIAIPEIQRPFVWRSSQVRDLIDSLYKGYPTGYIIEWFSPDAKLKDGSNSVGKKILIDGQQRVSLLFMLVYYINQKYHDEISIDYEFCDLQNASFGRYSEFAGNNYSLFGLSNSQANDVTESDKLG